MQDRTRWLKIGFTLDFYWENERSRRKNTILFPRLWKVDKLILIVPNFNAYDGWVFSIVRKNKTCFRPRLDPEETLASIITVKLAMESESVKTFNIPGGILAAAKSVTYKYKLSHLQ